VVDLSIPKGISDDTLAAFSMHYISIEALQKIANENIQFRMHELESCSLIINNNIEKFTKTIAERKVELAMQKVPEKIRHIKHTAINNVFAKEYETLDENSKEILEKIFNYVEKRYIAEPMILAKEILLQKI
jgi:glutamyl-tRNA reductase